MWLVGASSSESVKSVSLPGLPSASPCLSVAHRLFGFKWGLPWDSRMLRNPTIIPYLHKQPTEIGDNSKCQLEQSSAWSHHTKSTAPHFRIKLNTNIFVC